MHSILTALVLTFLLGCSPSGDKRGDTYRGVITGNIKSFDPAQAGDVNSITCQFQVYESLYEYQYLVRPYAVQPLLARALPQIDDSGLTYTITLKTDVEFQDDPCFPKGKGRRFTARDFEYSVKRFADVRNQTSGWWVLEGKVVGLDAWRKASEQLPPLPDPVLPALYDQPIPGLTVVNDSTIRIQLTRAYPYFKYLLAMPYLAVVPREAVLHYGEEFLNHPVGTGPYRLSEWRRSLRLRFDRNPKYHHGFYPREGEAGDSAEGLLNVAGQPLPFIDHLDISIFEEQQPMWLNFLRGRLDKSGIPKDNYNEAMTPSHALREDLGQQHIRLLRMREMYTGYISFNLKDNVLGGNPALRQAMALGYNVDEAITLFSNGRGIHARSPIPPGLFGYDSTFENPYSHFDTVAAKQKLIVAGYPNGVGLPHFEYLAVSGTDTRQLGEHFVQGMARLGIRIDLVSCTWPEYLDRLKKGKFQIVRAAWGADYPDPENFLQLLYGPNEAPGENISCYHNAVYDSLYRIMAVMQDSPERLLLIGRMQNLIAQDCPWIMTSHRLAETLVNTRLTHVKLNAVIDAPFKYYRLKP